MVCGQVGGTVGCEYPAVDLSVLGDTKPYEKRGAVPPERFEELPRPLRTLLGPHLPVLPGTQFGTIAGVAVAKVGDFAWQKPMTPLICREAYNELLSRGIQISGVTSEVRSRTKIQKELVVLQVEPRARWDESSFIEAHNCIACGRYLGKIKSLVIKESSVPKDADLFRISWHTMRVLCTEAFKNTVNELHLTDIAFKEIPVSET